MFLVCSLRQLNEIIEKTGRGEALLPESRALAQEVDNAIRKHAVVKHPKHGKIFAYEIDGFGGQNLMDDANVPNLLSIPYLGYASAKDPVYRNTREFLWSKSNPYFYEGKAGEGLGGPHCGKDKVWHMSIVMKALTSNDAKEIEECLRMLVNTDGGTGFMHESFHKDNPENFSRGWFAWSNSLFSELVIKVCNEYPGIAAKQLSMQ